MGALWLGALITGTAILFYFISEWDEKAPDYSDRPEHWDDDEYEDSEVAS